MPELDQTQKATNPKDAIGSDKLPMHLWPESATVMGTLGLLNGMLKYGRTNWREAGVRTSIYIDALLRHTYAYWEGEEVDPDDGVPHLSAMLACIAIIVDAKASGKLTDDRAYNGRGARALLDEMTPHVKRLKALHAGRDPKHWTIADEPAGPCDPLDEETLASIRRGLADRAAGRVRPWSEVKSEFAGTAPAARERGEKDCS